MTKKSHVGMGYALCPVCGIKHDETVLLDRRMRNSLERNNFTSWAMCVEHQKMQDEGYVALIVVTNTDHPTLENAQRTGEIMHIRSKVWPNIFNAPVPPGSLSFIDLEAATRLKERFG